MKHEFEAGDRVRIRQWDDMEKEFGINEFDSIDCKGCFTKDMKKICGKVGVLKKVYSNKEVEFFESYLDESPWSFSTDMLEPAPTITLKEFFDSKEKIGIHCDTKEKAEMLLKEFDKMGKCWNSGHRYSYNSNWEGYKEKTVYSNNGCYSSVNYCIENNRKIYEFEDVIFPPTPNFKTNYEIYEQTINFNSDLGLCERCTGAIPIIEKNCKVFTFKIPKVKEVKEEGVIMEKILVDKANKVIVVRFKNDKERYEVRCHEHDRFERRIGIGVAISRKLRNDKNLNYLRKIIKNEKDYYRYCFNWFFNFDEDKISELLSSLSQEEADYQEKLIKEEVRKYECSVRKQKYQPKRISHSFVEVK